VLPRLREVPWHALDTEAVLPALQAVLGGAAILLAIGILAMRRIVNIRA
jgi:hypothetical protein